MPTEVNLISFIVQYFLAIIAF